MVWFYIFVFKMHSTVLHYMCSERDSSVSCSWSDNLFTTVDPSFGEVDRSSKTLNHVLLHWKYLHNVCCWENGHILVRMAVEVHVLLRAGFWGCISEEQNQKQPQPYDANIMKINFYTIHTCINHFWFFVSLLWCSFNHYSKPLTITFVGNKSFHSPHFTKHWTIPWRILSLLDLRQKQLSTTQEI